MSRVIDGTGKDSRFFYNGQYRNPMVIRIASFAYQQGFGGHFHNDNTIAPLRDIPGVVIVAPARGDDGVSCVCCNVFRKYFFMCGRGGR